jgi:uroporphyrinogen-III synthase
MTKYKVLSTKKLDASLVEKAKENDIEIIEQEAISVHSILTEEKANEIMPFILSKDVQSVVFTSSNAVETIKKFLRQDDTWIVPNWDVFCISGKTKDLLHPYINPSRIIATAEYGKDLAERIIENGVMDVVFFSGNKRRDELPLILKEAGVTIHEIVIYETIETPQVSTEDIDGILFFSPSAVQSFFSVNQLKKETVCFSIGYTTAESVAGFTDNRTIISEAPSQEMILASVHFYFANKACYE